MSGDRLGRWLLASAAALVLSSSHGLAQQPKPAAAPGSAAAAVEIADFFSQIGDQLYENCIFELSEEQIEVQEALAQAYIKRGASSALARQLAAKQIEPPKLSDKCEQLRSSAKTTPPKSWDTTVAVPKKPPAAAA